MKIEFAYWNYEIYTLRQILDNNVDNLDYYDFSNDKYYPRFKQAVYFKDRVNLTDVEYLIKTYDLIALYPDLLNSSVYENMSGRDKIFIKRMYRIIKGEI